MRAPHSETFGDSAQVELKPRGSLEIVGLTDLYTTRRVWGAFDRQGCIAEATRGPLARVDHEARLSAGSLLTRDPVRIVEEEVVWGGAIWPHYGHFLTECVAQLWPVLPGQELEGLPVAFAVPFGEKRAPEWFEAFGLRRIELPEEGIVRFNKMFVPEAAWRLLEGPPAPEMRDVHLHAREGLDVSPSPQSDLLWLSRSRLRKSWRIAYDECLLEWLLEDHITAISPESMTIAEQVSAVEHSRAVAGVIGSAFHSLLMARKPPECLYLCPEEFNLSYISQARLLGSDSHFALALEPMFAAEGRFPQGYRVLIPEALRALDATLRPGLLDDPRLASCCDPAGRGSSWPFETELEREVAAMIADPLSIKVRKKLALLFDAEGMERCAEEQRAAVAGLSGEVDPSRIARLRGD